MTLLDVTPVEDVDTETASLHIACCVVEKFICGAAYHPEMAAGVDANPRDVCEACAEVVKASACYSVRAGLHFHCVVVAETVCPWG